MLNYLTLNFPLSERPPTRIVSFSLSQERYAHEMATVRFRDWDTQYTHVQPGQPVSCTIRGTGTNREFVGYIHDIRPSIDPGKRFVDVSLIGASYQLKQARQRVFENITASDVIRKIASEHNFSTYVEDHPRIYDQVTQAGHSDLQLMTRLAKQCGYSLRIENTSIHFKNVVSTFNTYKSSAQRYDMRTANDPSGSTLYSFYLTVGESIRYVDAYKSSVQIGGVNPESINENIVTNQIRPEYLREKSETEYFDSFATNVVAPSYEVAYYEAKAADERNRFAYRAKVEVIGTPTIGPDKPVYLSGLGPDYSGYWMVLSAKHNIVETAPNVLKYTTTLEVGTDSLGRANLFNAQDVTAPSTTPTRVLTLNSKNVAETPKSMLTTGTTTNSNPAISVITTRDKGAKASNARAYLWVAEKGKGTAVTTDTTSRTSAVNTRLSNAGLLLDPKTV